MNLSNVIAQMIYEMLEDKSEIEIQRNILAQDLGCVPSQINYVLSSRFTPEQGYVVESRRGGGGCIRISRISLDRDSLLAQTVYSLPSSLNALSAKNHIAKLLYYELINDREAALMLAATSDSCFRGPGTEFRDSVRASILKQMLLSLLKEQ